MSDLKPKQPSNDGRQYARNPYGSNELSVHYDKALDEIPEDRPMHGNSTPQQGGAPDYSGRQYADDFRSYGSGVSGKGTAERTSVDVSRANRGKEQ